MIETPVLQLPGTPNAPPAFKLYDVGQITAGTFLGSPLAGGWMLAANFSRLGNTTAALQALVVTVVSTVALLGVAMVLPEDLPSFGIPALYTFATGAAAKSLQGAAIDNHLARGGKKASGWKAIGIGVLCLVCILGGVFLVAQALEDRVEVAEGGDVSFELGATEQEATVLGEALVSMGYPPPFSVNLTRPNGVYAVSFVVTDGAWEDPYVVSGFREVGDALSDIVFAGQPVRTFLMDSDRVVRKEALSRQVQEQ